MPMLPDKIDPQFNPATQDAAERLPDDDEPSIIMPDDEIIVQFNPATQHYVDEIAEREDESKKRE